MSSNGNHTAPQYTHSKALISYLITTYSKHRQSSTTSPPQANATLQLERSLKRLAVEQARAASATASASTSTSEASGTDTEDDESATAPSLSSVDGSGSAAGDELTEDDKQQRVLEMLEDDSIEEEDKPDALKDLFKHLLVLPSNEPVNLDPLILALLHRYREDISPSGNPLPPLPNHGSTTPGSRPSVSRSSSFRRLHGASTPLGNRSASGSLSVLPSNASSLSAPTSPSLRSAPHSPWSSPRPTQPSLAALSANASEFKFSAGAADFKPGGHASPRTPGTPLRSHSPNPMAMAAQQAQAQWAATASPLGTPKHGGQTPNHAGSTVSSPSYFPQNLAAGVQQQLRKGKIPRLPWADSSEGDDDDEDQEEGEGQAESEDNQQTSFERDGSGYVDTAPPPHPQWAEVPPGVMLDPAYGQQYPGMLQTPDGGWVPVIVPQPYGGYAGGAMWDGAYDEEGSFQHGHPSGQPQFHRPPQQHHQSTYEGAHMTLPGPRPGEMPSIDFANELAGPAGLGGMGAYMMSPFDHLLSIFASSGVSPEALEEALTLTGFDVDKAIEHIIDTQDADPAAGDAEQEALLAGAPEFVPRAAGSGSRPMIVSRDSFDGFGGGRGAGRWGSRPQTPTADNGRGVGGRVCRYYLAGNCLRSDCKFSHDVGKAVCKFWLRGHCLKGDGRCDFLHSIPPIMRADFEQRAQRRMNVGPGGQMYEDQMPHDSGPDLDFPSLGDAPRAHRSMGGPRPVQLDPARTRFSGAVKFGQVTAPQVPVQPIPAPPAPTRESLPRARKSARITLRGPALLPTLPTGPALAALYVKYRSSFLELGANRNKCLARAAECWKRGDGAGARKFSREAQDWSRQVAIEGRDSAAKIVDERKRVLKEAVINNEGRTGTADDVPDRKVRGKEMGGGICLGVVAQSMLPRGERHLTADERTEVALDLHALHTDEAISFMGDFILKLEQARFAGLAFVVIGQSKHSGSSAPDRAEAAGRLRLEQACSEFASDQGWAWDSRDGIMVIDCIR